jgi:signal peptidase II
MSPQSTAEAPAAVRTSFNLRTPLLMLAMVTAPVIALDQFTKLYVQAHMQLYENIPLVPNWLDITFTRNPGAAFSMFMNLPDGFRSAMLFGFAGIAIVVIFVLLAAGEQVTLTSVALALILAGAAGNLIDRAARGEVIDFVRAHYYAYNWPVFNVADSAISIGVALIVLSSLLSPRHPQ